MAKPRKKIEPPDALVALTIRVHPEARRQLKSSAALEDLTMEEKGRSLIYNQIGLGHLPVSVDSTTLAAAN